MIRPITFDKNIVFDNLTKEDVIAIENKSDTISFCIKDSIVCTPTITEKMTVEAKTNMSYEEYLISFLKTCNIKDLCEKYNAEEKDIPVVIAMAIFEEV